MSLITKRKAAEESALQGEVAIVGMACIFPSAPNLQSYWQNILAKVDAVSEVPEGRWDAKVHYAAENKDNEDMTKVYCKRGGYLDAQMSFDPLKYGVMPLGVEGGEPDQFLVLQVVHEALRDAGYLNQNFRGERTEFILGRGNYLGVGASNLIQRSLVTEQTLKILKSLHPEYTSQELAEIRKELLSCLPKVGAENAAAFIPNLTTGRVANRLNFMGPNFTIDAACASSLIAAEIGVRDLLTGACDLAIVGGVHIFAGVPFLLIFCAFQAMSLSSRIRPFDQEADGTIPGEGVGVVILKRREEAERDKDRIYAIIKGVGSASDGRAVSVTAPRVEGEELALRRAYSMAKISPDTIRLIEAHGVGTVVGDVVEMEAMRRVFGPRQALGPSCALGTVKSMIGHAMPAAGIAGLIKAALSVYHKVLPPTLHCTTINPKLEIDQSPFYLNTETRPWIHGESNFPRRAGVNAFGFGGINAHLIIEEQVDSGGKNNQTSSPAFWDTEVCVLAGESRPKLIHRLEEIKKFLEQNPQTPLRDIAFSLNTNLGLSPYRLAVVASSIDDLKGKLAYAKKRLSDPECHQIKDLKGIYFFESPLNGKLAFLFPGEGSQYINMLADLCIYFPEIRSCFDKADRILLEQGQVDIPSYYIFPPPFFSDQERRKAEEHLWKMDRATEAVLIGNLALYTLMQELSLKPDQMVGHSAGEWSAMIFSGIINVEEFMQNTRKLNQIYQRLSEDPNIPKATLLAVGTSRSHISSVIEDLEGTMYIANDNCPHQVVIIGEEKVANEAMTRLRSVGIPTEKLPFDRGYHTPMFSPICPHLREYFSSFSFSSPHTEIYSCNTMSPYPHEPERILKLAVETWVLPVAFHQTIEKMYETGTRIFVEVGPKGNLTAFVEDTLRGKPHLAIPSNVARRSGLSQLNHMIGLLSAQGISLNYEYLYRYRSPNLVTFEAGDLSEKSQTKAKEMSLNLGWYNLQLKAAERKEKHLTSYPHSQDISPLSSLGVKNASSNGGRQSPSSQGDGPLSELVMKMMIRELSAENDKGISSPLPSIPGDVSSPASSVMEHYFQTMGNFLETQAEMMEAYLEQGQRPAISQATDGDILQIYPMENLQQGKECAQELLEEQIINLENKPAIEDDLTKSDLKQRETGSINKEDIALALVKIVSEKTGYPQDMIDLRLDMEGDLGIDSIKRVEIIGSFREKYAQALKDQDLEAVSDYKTLEQVIDFLQTKISHSSPSAPSTGPEERERVLPFIGKIAKIEPGKRVIVYRPVDLVEDLFLEDHRFGQKISESTTTFLGALPVIPLTVSIEIMAEAASLLFPGQKLVSVEQIAANQWISLEGRESILLKITARVVADGKAQVQIEKAINEEALSREARVVISGLMVFGQGYTSPPPSPVFVLEEEKNPAHTAEQIYTEHRMFHGQRFQGISSLDKVGKNGLLAELQILPRDNLFQSYDQPDFFTDPFLLDAAGQLVGYWPVEYLESGFVIFPIALEKLMIYKEIPAPGQHLRTRLRIRQVAKNTIVGDLDLFGENGELWMQLIGWTDWRFYWSKELYDFWRFPNQGSLGKALELSSGENPLSSSSYSVSVLQQFWRGQEDIFQHVMASMILSQKEREHYWRLPAGSDQGDWLLKKMVLKDVVKSYFEKEYHLSLFPADIDILLNKAGRFSFSGPWQTEGMQMPSTVVIQQQKVAVAVSAKAGMAVGAAMLEFSPLAACRKGNHICKVEAASSRFNKRQDGASTIFSDCLQGGGVSQGDLIAVERAWLNSLNREAQEEWSLRISCAKEAAKKALKEKAGEGLALTLARGDLTTGLVEFTIQPALDRQESILNCIPVYTVRDEDFILAITIF